MTDSIPLDEWRGAFGDSYISRNEDSAENIRRRVPMWARILRPLAGPSQPPASVLEVGANIGLNLRALSSPTGATLHALEPNATARQRLIDDGVLPQGQVLDGSAIDIGLTDESIDLVFTCGVLIHVSPEDLLAACREMHRVAKRYILSVEYFAQTPEERTYHSRDGLLFKRDFGSFWIDNFPDLELVDYGFFWKPATGIDDLTFWLFRKSGR